MLKIDLITFSQHSIRAKSAELSEKLPEFRLVSTTQQLQRENYLIPLGPSFFIYKMWVITVPTQQDYY